MLNFNPTNINEMTQALMYVLDEIQSLRKQNFPEDLIVRNMYEWIRLQSEDKKNLFQRSKQYLGIKRLKLLKEILKKEGV